MIETISYNKHQIYGILKNYFWYVNEIQKFKFDLSKTDFRGASQWGVESTLPKPQGIVSKALENEVIRRTEKSERMVKYASQINFINGRRDRITEEKEKVVLDCLLDGLSINAIAQHLRTGRKQINMIIDKIVDAIADK